METDTIDAIDEKEEALTRPSSWAAAIAQLPGFPDEVAAALPRPSAGAAREVTSEVAEDLAGDEEAPV